MEVLFVLLLATMAGTACLVLVTIYLYRKTQLQKALLWKRQTQAHQMGVNQAKGDMFQILGTLAILADYDQLGFVSTASRQMSVDVIGIKNDGVDFIEFKKKGAALKPNESKLRRLVEAKQVHYQVKDIELPEGFKVDDRSA
jgi:hypothetical protein